MSNIAHSRYRVHRAILISSLLASLLFIHHFLPLSLANLKDGSWRTPMNFKSRSPISRSSHAEILDSNAPFIGWPLQRLCNETQWTSGLVFDCSNNSGGIGNIRNYILTCLRYAIEAGATGLLIPRIRARSNSTLELSNTSKDFQPFSYFFNEAHFRLNLGEHCPQISIHNGVDDVSNREKAIYVEKFSPKGLGDREGCNRQDLNRHTSFFRPTLHNWLNNSVNPPTHTPTTDAPVIISLVWATFFEWPVYIDGPEFVATFGGLLRFREDVIELADTTLRAMEGSRWMGVHLRTESDALKWWPDFTQQSTAYLKSAISQNFTQIYLASGSSNQTKQFSELAATYDIKIITKTSLLSFHSPSSLAYLHTLIWDQQALVDFLVLLQSEYFMGCSTSSFAMNVALKRHLLIEGLRTRPWNDPGDVWSGLVGRFKGYWDDWLFMRDAMWP